MTENSSHLPIPLAPDEKAVPVMVYFTDCLYLGSIVLKKQYSATNWLRNQMAPDFITLHQAKHMLIFGASTSHPSSYSELHIPTADILAFHLQPPEKDPPDFDLNEPNRKMEPVTALVGSFCLAGSLHMVSKMDISHYLEMTRETFTSLYNVEVVNINLPNRSPLRVESALVRKAKASFASRQSSP
jgi:hypothetical protein